MPDQPDVPPLRYLTAANVEAAIPPVAARIELAARAMLALLGEAELPPKIAVHPRPPASFAHAMPAHLRDSAGTADLLGMKWIAGFPTNNSLGIRTLHALVLLNDPTTGVPVAILDGGPLTAHRTAAVSGVAIRAFAPVVTGRQPRVALTGAGVQGHSHLPIIAHLLPGAELTLYDRHPERVERLAAAARGHGIADVRAASSAREAIDRADVVITAVSFGPVRQTVPPDWIAPGALVVAVDYATSVSAAVARGAALFVVDERGQLVANRDAGLFDDYPDPATTLGEVLRDGTPRPPGRVVVTHLGVGIADLIFAHAILRGAAAAGLGTVLPR
ncbi:MAG: ornithine cyclodeaminase family protein [Chloroflexi bacterium]|nr:ornithine cyclodeaminase family protein [Chloroflexota bacterium]